MRLGKCTCKEHIEGDSCVGNSNKEGSAVVCTAGNPDFTLSVAAGKIEDIIEGLFYCKIDFSDLAAFVDGWRLGVN